jgi:methionyl aminopeptidase
VVKEYCGHGIGKIFHDEPQVLHYGKRGTGAELKAGMTFTIEPMITLGTWQHRMWNDDWTAVTADGKRTAQFEHTVLVTDTGVDVLTGGPGAASPNAPWKR